MQIRRRRYAALMLAVILLISGCGRLHVQEILPGSSLSSHVLLVSGEEELPLEEGRIWLWAVRASWEKDYGEEIWELSLPDGTVEEELKEAAKTYIQDIFFSAQSARSSGMRLSEEMESLIDQAAEACLAGFSEEERKDPAWKETLVSAYTRLVLSRCARSDALSASNLESSEEDARVMRVGQITLGFSDSEEKTAKKKEADRILKRIDKGSSEFVIQALEHSDEEEIERTIVRDDLDRDTADEVFALEDGEVSGVLETDGAYQIFLCIESDVEEETEANRNRLREEKLEAIYEEGLEREIEETGYEWNDTAWEKLSVPDEEAGSLDFFGIYEEFLSDAVAARTEDGDET